MKPVLKHLDARWLKSFFDGTALSEQKRFSQEYVNPGVIVRNDPLHRKTPARWRYNISNDVALQNDPEAPYEWNYRQVHVLTGTIIMKAVGVQGTFIPDPLPQEYDYSDVYNQALSRLNDQVRGNLDLSVALAEAGKTAQMIDRVGKVLKFARKVKPKGGFRRPGPLRHINDASHAAANGYLEFKYGWKPLLSDIFAVADESINLTFNQLQTFRASAKIPIIGDYKEVPVAIEALSAVPMRIFSDGGKKCARIQMALQIPDSSFDIARWTSLNPLSLGWELIPYSFVVDWFVDVGSYLRNIETALYYNVQFRHGFVSKFCYWPMSARIRNYSDIISGYKCEAQGLWASKLFMDFSRVVLTSYPMPSLPRFSADLGSSQLTSAAALLRQLLRRA